LEVLEGRALPAPHVWTGASGIDLNWSRAANWDSGVPGAGDVAIFNNTAANRFSVVDPGFAGTVAGLTLDANWGAALTLAHSLIVTGNSSWASGTLNGGSAGLINNGVLTVTSQFDKTLLGVLINNDTIAHTGGGGGRLFVSDGTTISNAGTYDFQADGVGIAIGSGTTSAFVNTGTVRKSAGSSVDRSYLHVSSFINDGGSFDVQTGRLALGEARVSGTGAVTAVAEGAVLDLTDNSQTTYSGTFGNGTGLGKVRLLNGTLAVGGTPAVFDLPAGMLEWAGGTLNGSAAGFVIDSGWGLTVTSQFDKTLLGLLSNNGTIAHTGGGGGRLFVSDGTTISNAGTYDFQADGVGIAIGGGSTSAFVNTGTVRKSAGSSTDRSYLHVSSFINDGGSFDVQTGRLALGEARVTSTGGSFSVAEGAVLDLTDNSLTTYSGTFGNDTGLGKVSLLNGALAVASAGATFNFAGALEWDGGVLDGGTAGLTNSGLLTVTSQFDKTLLGLLINNGTIAHAGGGGRLFVSDGTTINNAGTYDFQGDGAGIVLGGGLSSTFTNTGTVRKSAGAGAVTLSVSFFTNANLVDVQSGTLNLSAGGASTGTFNTAGGASLRFTGGLHALNDGATFTGNGSAGVAGGTLVINAVATGVNFTVTGGTLELSAGASLGVSNYTQTGGLLAIDVSGPDDGEHGRLDVAGQALLGGGLRISLVGPYTPGQGDAFVVLTYGFRGDPATAFGGYDFPPLVGLHLQPNYDDGTGSLTIVTVPN
jgi:hypothetical protein